MRRSILLRKQVWVSALATVALVFHGLGIINLPLLPKINEAYADTEAKYADTHITGDATNPNNAIGAADGLWAGVVNSATDFTSRWSMENPSGAITGTQTVGVIARKGSNSGTPTLAINLYENGSLIQSVAAATNVTSTVGQTVSGTFNASAITNRDNVEIQVVVVSAGGGPSARNSAQIDEIEWTVNLSPAAYSQAAFRFYEDGTESGSTAIANQDTNITRNVSSNSNLHLRFRIQETNNASNGLTTDDWQLQYSKNSGTYQNIDSWSQIGNGLTVSTTTTPALAELNSTDVASNISNTLRTYRFDGTDWSQVGNGLSVNGSALSALNSTDVANYSLSTGSLSTYRFNGTDWSQVGNGLTISLAGTSSLATLNSTDIAFFGAGDDSLRVYRFDGTDWSQVGNGLTISGGTPALAALSSTDIAFIDADNDSLRTYRFNGTDWSQVGNGLTISGFAFPALAALSSTEVALLNGADDSLRTYRFDGTDWSQGGNGLTTISGAGSPALAALNSTDVAFIDDSNDSLRTYRAPGSEVIGFDSSLSNGGVTTSRLTGGSGSFLAGEISEDGLVDDHQITAGEFTEYLYSLTLVSSALADSDTLDFRIVLNGSVISSYSVTPRVTVSIPPGPTMDQVMRGGNWFSGGTEQSYFWAD